MGASVMKIQTKAETQLLEALQKHQASAEVIELFTEQGLPHRRVEAWKYTDLRKSMAVFPSDIVLLQPADFFEQFSSLPQGVTAHLEPIEKAQELIGDAQDAHLVQLNAGFVRQVLVIEVAAGVQLYEPLSFHFSALGRQAAAFAHIEVRMGEGARATLIERSAMGTSEHLSVVQSFNLARGAELSLLRLHADDVKALHFGVDAVHMGAEAKLHRHALNIGAELSRAEFYLDFAGDHGELHLQGAQLVGGTRHSDITLHIRHTAPHCVSTKRFKTLLAGEAHGVFQGKIHVEKDAQKTDAKMKSEALMLSETAEMSAKPELEIYADDVLCAHGATCGALDPDHLFYLMARGIPRADAEAVLLQAFVMEAFEGLDDGLLAYFTPAVEGWLTSRL